MSKTRLAGDLTLAEMRRLEELRHRTLALQQRIGALEVERHRLVVDALAAEADTQCALHGVAIRLGIPDGEEWTVGQDGVVHVVTP